MKRPMRHESKKKKGNKEEEQAISWGKQGTKTSNMRKTPQCFEPAKTIPLPKKQNQNRVSHSMRSLDPSIARLVVWLFVCFLFLRS